MRLRNDLFRHLGLDQSAGFFTADDGRAAIANQ